MNLILNLCKSVHPPLRERRFGVFVLFYLAFGKYLCSTFVWLQGFVVWTETRKQVFAEGEDINAGMHVFSELMKSKFSPNPGHLLIFKKEFGKLKQ